MAKKTIKKISEEAASRYYGRGLRFESDKELVEIIKEAIKEALKNRSW